MESDLMAGGTAQSAAEIRAQIAQYGQEITALSAALRDAENVRKSLLLTGSNKEIALYDAGMDRTRLDLERAGARAAALKAELPAVEKREEKGRQDRVHAELVEMHEEYRALVTVRYPDACRPLIALMKEMRQLAGAIEARGETLPYELRVRPDEFRISDPKYYCAPIPEGVRLPSALQVGPDLWPEPTPVRPTPREAPRAPVRIDEFARPPVVHDGRLEPGGITVTRVPLAQWMAEREARLKAEERAKSGGGR